MSQDRDARQKRKNSPTQSKAGPSHKKQTKRTTPVKKGQTPLKDTLPTRRK